MALAARQPSASTTHSAHTPSSRSQSLGAPHPAPNLPQVFGWPGGPSPPFLYSPFPLGLLLPGEQYLLSSFQAASSVSSCPLETHGYRRLPLGPHGPLEHHPNMALMLPHSGYCWAGQVAARLPSARPSQTRLAAAHSVTHDSPSGGGRLGGRRLGTNTGHRTWPDSCLCLGSGFGWFSRRESVTRV